MILYLTLSDRNCKFPELVGLLGWWIPGTSFAMKYATRSMEGFLSQDEITLGDLTVKGQVGAPSRIVMVQAFLFGGYFRITTIFHWYCWKGLKSEVLQGRYWAIFLKRFPSLLAAGFCRSNKGAWVYISWAKFDGILGLGFKEISVNPCYSCLVCQIFKLVNLVFKSVSDHGYRL